METTPCPHPTDSFMVTGGVVRCGECFECFHEHEDSDPRPGMVEENQTR